MQTLRAYIAIGILLVGFSYYSYSQGHLSVENSLNKHTLKELLVQKLIAANTQEENTISFVTDSAFAGENAVSYVLTQQDEKQKLVALLLALPFPVGIIGAHRIYLGAKPYIPVVYIATLGGCFGILPMIDFVVIATSKDLSRFENNDKLFMWVK
ncbi:MAG: TM2 domain-containing protein [Bacteroidetes bacterium]|nr:TM2 domain-containing protein [Bacteroidota bacterium]